MIHVVATIQLHPGKRAEFLEHFRALVPQVRAEDGCLEYGPTIDASGEPPASSSPRADAVVVIEQWRDLDALRAHLQADHMAAYRERVSDLVASVELQVLQPA